MAAGLVETDMKMTDVVGLIDAEAVEVPVVRLPNCKAVIQTLRCCLRSYWIEDHAPMHTRGIVGTAYRLGRPN
jgi:hypothetical protein